MSKIKVMPELLANKIAAGEVVERPSSVVKELLENALDAGAGKVDIEIEAGGKRLIRIVDDGEGMTRDDAIMAFERHATSKLRTLEELDSINTFGFRGEALPSIAAVSHLFLRTGLATQPEGTEIEFNGGRLVAVRDVAWPGGTEVEIKELFLNVPARRKYLKSDSTETFHITNLLQHYALANAAIGFMLIRDGREVIHVTPVATLKERAYQVLGPAIVEKLNAVEFESGGVRITGFASNPQEQRSSREAQYLFVNHRFVRDQLIGRALADAYRSMMPAGVYPAAILFIDVPPAEVDINVHPAKTEVRFLHEGAVLGVVRTAIKLALEASQTITQVPPPALQRETPARLSSVPSLSSSESGFSYGRAVTGSPSPPGPTPDQTAGDEVGFNLTPPGPETQGTQKQLNLDLTFLGAEPVPSPTLPGLASARHDSYESSTALTGLLESEFQRYAKGAEASSSGCGEQGLASRIETTAPLPGAGHGIKPLGQIRDSYIVATDEEGLLLIDQHVAHERVLFEQFRDDRLARGGDAQPMLVPPTLDLTPAEAEAFGAVQEELDAMGIETMQLSGRTIAIKASPAGLSSGDAVGVVRDVLGAVERERREFTLDRIRDQIAASLACKAAIKVNMPLTGEKMQWLIDELMKTHNPMTCPHGRPILMRFGLRDIERGFKRPV
ncbi:MAG TPA: DNA mismatch repair endonuclease MutL [Blastocatellia bacterium]|nr:DNA mismatch repair endonuclease MutL [Blastocatellia bacterium]